MTFDIEIVLRDRQDPVADRLIHAGNRPAAWTDMDVEAVLKSMLLAIDRARNPSGEAPTVSLRGFSWIVEPAAGGVVIAIEMPGGAAVAGPFEIAQPALDQMIRRVLAAASPNRPVVH